jgi:predicted esterase
VKELPFTLDLPAAKEAWPHVYLFHGEKDDDIRPERGRAAQKALEGKGLTVRAKFYDDQNHFIFLEKGTEFLPACLESLTGKPAKSEK